MPYAYNRRAFHEYEILEKFEAGLALTGQEVKAVRQNKASLQGAYVKIIQGRPVLIGARIAPYQPKNAPVNYDLQRTRQLLLHRREIEKLVGKAQERRLTIVPLRLYNKEGRIKLEIALAKSRKKYEKRQIIREKEEKRRIERALKN